MKRVFKISLDDIQWHFSYAGQYRLTSYKNIPLGRVSLSLKKGKKRVLISGTIDHEVDSVRCDKYGSRLIYRHFFTPGTPLQVEKMKRLFSCTLE